MDRLLPRWFRARVGHRGFFLLFLAFLNFAVASSLISDQSNPLRRYDTTLPLPIWGWLWVAAGAVHLICAFRVRDRASFTIAAFIKGAWAAMYIDLTVTQGYPRGWVFAAVWGTFAINVLMVASWPEPPEQPEPPAPVPPARGGGNRSQW